MTHWIGSVNIFCKNCLANRFTALSHPLHAISSSWITASNPVRNRNFGTVILTSKIRKVLGQVSQVKGMKRTWLNLGGDRKLEWLEWREWVRLDCKTYFQVLRLLLLHHLPILFIVCDPNWSLTNNLDYFSPWYFPLLFLLYFHFPPTQDLCIGCPRLLNCDFLWWINP